MNKMNHKKVRTTLIQSVSKFSRSVWQEVLEEIKINETKQNKVNNI